MGMNRSPQSTILTDGIVAVVTTSTIAADQLVPGILGEAGPEPLVSVARATADLFKHTDELALRVVLKEHTISAKRRLDGDDETITVLVVVTGHPIVKSLARTLRAILKAARRNGPTPAASVPSADSAPAVAS